MRVAEIADAIPISIRVVRERRTRIADVTEAVVILVVLVGVLDRGTVVRPVGDSVAVHVARTYGRSAVVRAARVGSVTAVARHAGITEHGRAGPRGAGCPAQPFLPTRKRARAARRGRAGDRAITKAAAVTATGHQHEHSKLSHRRLPTRPVRAPSTRSMSARTCCSDSTDYPKRHGPACVRPSRRCRRQLAGSCAASRERDRRPSACWPRCFARSRIPRTVLPPQAIARPASAAGASARRCSYRRRCAGAGDRARRDPPTRFSLIENASVVLDSDKYLFDGMEHGVCVHEKETIAGWWREHGCWRQRTVGSTSNDVVR